MSLPVPAEQIHLTHPKYRPDIDGLRAVAILSVVGYHAFPYSIEGGFIGVDIFFVISGFLISSIIISSLEKGTFSFTEFYARRIKRIFPALLLVLTACLLFGWFALLPDEYKQLGKHIAAGAGLASNLILWQEAGYFDNAAQTKPLLHLWSLGIEEQFYILWPLLIFFAWKWRYNLLILAVTIAAISFAINIRQIDTDPVQAFYSPLTRSWELMAGSILAYLTLKQISLVGKVSQMLQSALGNTVTRPMTLGASIRNAQSVLGGILLTVPVFLLTQKAAFPGWWALLPIAGTLLIISAGQHAWLNRTILSHRSMVWFGLISYPFYLWHWPLLSFARIVEGGMPTLAIRLAGVIISIALAWLTYGWIEKPIRYSKNWGTPTIILSSLIVLSGVVGYGIYRFDGLGFRNSESTYKYLLGQLGKWDYRKNQTCIDKFGTNFPLFCISSSINPEVILFGDSHANQLYPGLVKSYGNSKGILSIGMGAPLDSVVVSLQYSSSHPWTRGYESYRSVLQLIKESPELKTVILAAHWEPLIHGNFVLEEKRLSLGNVYLTRENELVRHLDNEGIFKTGLEETIKKLLAANKNVIVAINTPEVTVTPIECLKHYPSGNYCSFKKENVLKRQQLFRDYLHELKTKYPNIVIFDPVPIICPGETCFIYNRNQLLYRDSSHISEYASEMIGEDLRFAIDSFK
jgi:peptidoglycan/LPS O-acetylase OafA/YrhL